VTVTGANDSERPLRVVERALGRSARSGASPWRDQVVVVPGGHRPGKPDQTQRDRSRARLPLPGGHRVVVLGCTVGAGQTMTTLMAGEMLAALRDDRIAVLDLNPGAGSLADRARAVPALAESKPAGPSRLKLITAQAAAAAAGEPGDAAAGFEPLSQRYLLTLADPGAAVVPRVLAKATQLILVAPASHDAATALAATREWLEAHGHGELADAAITVLNGVSRHTLAHVEQAEALVRGRCRAIVRIPWDDNLRKPVPPASGARPAPAVLSGPAVRAYTALAGVLVAAIATATAPGTPPAPGTMRGSSR
jgi:MinD-like ATPase involved in chromosome partitioning or flagellar assembly